jgi:hypothetical protein
MRRLSLLLLALVAVALLASPTMATAALALQGLGLPTRSTLSGTTWNTITIPSGTEYLRLKPIATPISVGIGSQCTDGGAVGSHHGTFAADSVEYVAVHSYGAVCIAGTASATVEIWAMTRGR